MDRSKNRKLLVSVFNAQEAREAVLGGGRIIDSEDPRSALGNIKPRNIMDISAAVLNYQRNSEVQLSTNIGEDQLLFDRTENSHALRKSAYEMAGKAAQAALGVALAMGTQNHPVNIVKVGVDGMKVGLVKEVLSEVVSTLKQTTRFRQTQVMAVLFVQDLDLWDERKKSPAVLKTLLGLREYCPVSSRTPGAIDLSQYAHEVFKDEHGKPLFKKGSKVTAKQLRNKGILPAWSSGTFVKLNELHAHSDFDLSKDPKARKTDKATIRLMVDAAADAGAHSIMLDTRIQTKASRISLLKLDSDPALVDLAQYDDEGGKKLPRAGVLTLDEIKFFVDYCHFRGIEANLAGSLQSYHAQQLWHVVTRTDQISTRGGSSVRQKNPLPEAGAGQDTRQARVTDRRLVQGLVPPEQGGCFNIPLSMQQNKAASELVNQLRRRYPQQAFYWVDRFGERVLIDLDELQGPSGKTRDVELS